MKLKKYIAAAMTAFIAISSVIPVNAKEKEQYEIRAPHMYAHSYAVMDANTGKILFGENVNKKIYPASTAKLMSAIVAVESGIPLDTMIKTKGNIVNRTTPGTYNLGMNGGEEYSLSALLHMSLIASAADATDTIADAIAGSRDAFAERMMDKVKELGLKKTSFDNPVGSDKGGGFYKTYSTAKDMCEIARYAMTVPTIRKIVVKSSYTITGKGSQSGRQISNTNWFYNRYPYNSDYFTIIGSKTGQTTAAGDVFIATAVDDEGHELICAYFGKGGKAETFRWINNLLTFAWKEYGKGNLHLTAGAYNIRYDANALAYTRSMDEDIIAQNSERILDLEEVISQKQAIAMIKASLSPELSGTRIVSYFNQVTGTDASCTKDFLIKTLKQTLPGMEDQTMVKDALSDIGETVTVQDAGCLCGSAIRSFPLYEASFPTYEMRSWNTDNPVPFASTMNLSREVLLSCSHN